MPVTNRQSIVSANHLSLPIELIKALDFTGDKPQRFGCWVKSDPVTDNSSKESSTLIRKTKDKWEGEREEWGRIAKKKKEPYLGIILNCKILLKIPNFDMHKLLHESFYLQELEDFSKTAVS